MLLAHELCAFRGAAYQGRIMRHPLAAVQLLGVGWTGSRSTILTSRAILARKGLKLNPRQLQEATTATLSAVVEAKKRPHWYLFEDATAHNSVGGTAKIREVLGVHRRRERFTIDALHLPASYAASVAKWGLGALDQHVMGSRWRTWRFTRSSRPGRFRWGSSKPPVYLAPALPT